MWIWYGYLQRVIIPFLKSCHEIWVDFLNYPLDFCPVGGYREHESNEDSDSGSDSDSDSGNSESDSDNNNDKLTTVLEKNNKNENEDDTDEDEADVDEEADENDNTVVNEDSKPEYSSISQFLITGILHKCMTSVSNKSFLDEWIIVDKKHIEKNNNIDDKKNE